MAFADKVPLYGRADLLIALLIFVISSAVFPASHSLWVDESSSYFFASLDTGRFFEHLANAEANMSLYYAALKLYLLTGLSNEYYLRSLSVIFGLLAIACMYGFCRNYLDHQVARWVAILAAFNPFLFKFFWEARSYSMTLFFGSLLLWLFWLSLARNTRRHWLLYGLAAGVGLYSHIFLVLLILGQYGFALYYCYTRHNFSEYLRHLLQAGFLMSLISAPLLYFFITVGGNAPNIDWINTVGISHIWGFLENILKSKYSWHRVPETLSTLLVMYCLTMSLLMLLRGYIGEKQDRNPDMILYLGICALSPVLAAYALQFIKPMFVERYLIFVAPAFLILCVTVILSSPYRWLRPIGILAMGATQALGMYESHHRNKFDYYSLYADLVRECKPNSTLIFTNASVATTYLYYKNRYPGLSACFDRVIPGTLSHENFYHKMEFSELPAPGASTWVVFGHAGSTERSIYKLHDLDYLAGQGIARPFYRQYPINLALIHVTKD